ncbi:MAG: serine/threonine-protein kinase [Nostocaceae cyanobacterium]|nr:serine/threonine-protein kinase [Nostocaceae cyanobacterium]
MKFCTQIGCLRPQNPDTANFCSRCGQPILLKDRYCPVSLLGRGGFGRTFLAVDEHIPSKPQCVIKQLCFPQENACSFLKAVQLFRQEARRLDELGKHPQIPQLLAHFEQQQQLYLVQEFIPGKTLAQELRDKGTFGEAEIWELLKDLLPVLQFIHTQKVIHRDIKPANIIRRNPQGDLVLIDFGVAKIITATALQRTGTTVGSAEYMAPEQTRGKVVPASDLYSLGVTCIYLLTGVSPFDLFDVTNDCWAWRNYLSSGKQVSDRLGKILDKLLQNALSQRYKSADEVLSELTAKPQSNPTKIISQPVANISNPLVEIDYTKLRDLLAAGKWQKADEETWFLMCQSVCKSFPSYLYTSDINKIPCADLLTIDHLWMKYSKGRFGFSVQRQIYESVDGDYGRFCAVVGWQIYNPNSATFKYKLSAPMGHLPSCIWAGGSQLWRPVAALVSKLAESGMI